jgi:UDP-N-acetylglucosamine diphosphorylase/glucosamine-1-phosphate N-acetyltransferase
MKVIFFEDANYRNFYPVSLSRPIYMLLLGTSRIYEKWLMALKPRDYSFLSRYYLGDIVALETGKETNKIPEGELVFVNGRFLPSGNLISDIKKLKPGEAVARGPELAALRFDNKRPAETDELLSNLHEESALENLLSRFRTKESKVRGLNYIWDLADRNGETIENEFAAFRSSSRRKSKTNEKADLINSERIVISGDVSLGPTVAIDASSGPVILDKGVTLEPFTYVQGPAYIGPGCRLVGGRIREGCSFGRDCRVGGEVENTIMTGYCNKYHEGFLGHAYLGEWINIGALTSNSDLKNNYSSVSVEIDGQAVDTGKMKIGCFIGDHTKTGIGTLLNTGISVGFSSNLYGGLFAEKRIPSFGWGTPGEIVPYKLDKACQTARASMARRNVEFSEVHEKLFTRIKELDGRS